MADFTRSVLLDAARLSVPKDHTLADTMYDRVITAIRDFEQSLDEDQEIGARLANFGASITIAIDDIGYHNPFLFKIYGFTPDGERCELLQHVSQLNILLVAVKAVHTPPRRVGFLKDSDSDSK